MMKPTQERLIDAATILLDSGGAERVTLREVGRLAGVSHNAPYRHFTDKRALLAAIAARELELGVERYRAAAQGEQTLEEALRAYVRRGLQYPERFHLIYSDALLPDAQLERISAEVRSALLDAVRIGQAKGELPTGDADRIGGLLRACAYGATIRSLERAGMNATDATEPEMLIAELFRHFRK